MAKVENNKAVFITYTLTDEDGNVLERNDLPVGYVHGTDSGLLDKVEKELEGHVAGDKLEIKVRPEDGVGYPDPNLVFVDVIKNVPPEYRHIGAQAQFNNDEGETKTFVVTDISNGKVTLDGNHPFAGKTMVFAVTITEVRDATADEISTGSLEDTTQTVH